jgi:hypothetical protein
MFWKDKWQHQILQIDLPESFSFVKDKAISVNKVFNLESIFDMFNLPLSKVAFGQVQNDRDSHIANENDI